MNTQRVWSRATGLMYIVCYVWSGAASPTSLNKSNLLFNLVPTLTCTTNRREPEYDMTGMAAYNTPPYQAPSPPAS